MAPGPRCICSACGTALESGAPSMPAKFSSGFMDGPALAARDQSAGARLCPSCVPFFGKMAMLSLQKCYIDATGAYSLAKNVERVHFWRNLPEPPFVVVFSDTKLSHMIWRTPVTRDRRLVYLRVGAKCLTVRTEVLLQAERAARKVMDAAEKASGQRPWSVYLTADQALLDPDTHTLREWVVRAAEAAGLRGEIAYLRQLGVGEAWALPALLRDDLVPEPPRKLSIIEKKQKPSPSPEN